MCSFRRSLWGFPLSPSTPLRMGHPHPQHLLSLKLEPRGVRAWSGLGLSRHETLETWGNRGMAPTQLGLETHGYHLGAEKNPIAITHNPRPLIFN